jgi:hypothetical protein
MGVPDEKEDEAAARGRARKRSRIRRRKGEGEEGREDAEVQSRERAKLMARARSRDTIAPKICPANPMEEPALWGRTSAVGKNPASGEVSAKLPPPECFQRRNPTITFRLGS